ncbi:type II secretion system F family protein [Salinibacterium soli]|uniref:Type II secretion system F family protein n=1 Tax=Antiquaquibacter soli TaxID=3064523 RepID=A0ABT9BK63_9MICO|nr:type II secretion system F family protein [Protaetiibacter sp. WY-16]MDO7881413.1 type II secretion system F family protein [Protaetiibacter sp. WY-16]
MVRVTAWAVVAGTGLGLGLWMLASMLPRLNRPRLARRVAPYLQDVSAGAREFLAPPPPGPLPVLSLLLRPVADPLFRLLGSLLGGPEQVARRLRQAGSRLSVEAFRSQQVLSGILGAVVGVGVAIVAAHVGPAVQVVLVAGCGVGGILLRDALLQRTAKARLARLSSELPVILEFLTLSLSAGEGIMDALRRVARTGSGELSREFADVVTAVGTGLPLAETLAALARDLELPPLTRCIEQITGALERGSPLAEVLRAQAQDARDDAKRELLEVAGRKEVAMMFPLVFLILPVTILFAVFPGIVVLQVGF